MLNKKIILASASPRRQEILKSIVDDFEIVIPICDENIKQIDTKLYVQELALLKTAAVAKGRQDDVLIIGADTIVELDGKILGKPSDEFSAELMLKSLSDRTHCVYTGICVYLRESGQFYTDFEKTQVTFNKLTQQTIDKYIDSGSPMDKAGAYGIQDSEFDLIKEIKGDYYNVVGLPLVKLLYMIKKRFGIQLGG